MRISIRFLTGSTLSIEAEPSDTIDSVKSKIQDERGIPEESQRLLYAGKPLEDGRDLRSYGIKAEATLALIVRTGGSTATQPVWYRELGPSPSYEAVEARFNECRAVEARVKEWRAVAERGSFDDDLDIVDPDIYYRSLEILAEDIAKRSEFRRCQGIYDLLDEDTWDSKTVPYLLSHFHFQAISETIRTAFINQDFSSWPDYLNGSDRAAMASLWKTSLILSGILSGLRQLQKTKFCQSSFSLLLKHRDLDVAEIIKIPINDVEGILEGTLHNLEGIYELGEATNSSSQESLDALVLGPCISILGRLYWPIDLSGRPDRPPVDIILTTARMTALLLDIALISYMGSHACQFDIEYLEKDMGTFEIGSAANLPGFRCSLRRLACLEDFLDKRKVWMFEFPTKDQIHEPNLNERLQILTKMEDFADIWGPVYEIAGPQGSNKIRQYNVSKGIICRESSQQPIITKASNNEKVTRDAIQCHWHNKVSWLKGLKWKYLPPVANSYLSPDDLLLIGNIMVEKDSCRYTLDGYEKDYGRGLNELGTRDSSWRWDNRGMSLGISKIFGVTVAGTQKRIPETTLKETILNKWLNNPERRNPHVLNQYLGVEISHCSGNARRIAVRTILTLTPMIQSLDRQFPDWQKTPWGVAFWSAISGNDDSAIERVWKQFEKNRPQMGQIVAFALDVLGPTGLEDSRSRFSVGYLHQGQELSVDLEIGLNTWALLLKDNSSSASFAMVSDRCLLCNVPDHSSATCSESSGSDKARTTLQTRLAVQSKGKPSESKLFNPASLTRVAFRSPISTRTEHWQVVYVKPGGHRFRRVKSIALGTTYGVVVRPEIILKSLLPSRHWVSEGFELRNPIRRSWHSEADVDHVVTYIQALELSYGGMAEPRTQAVERRDIESVEEVVGQETGQPGQDANTGGAGQARIQEQLSLLAMAQFTEQETLVRT